ncbi:MAG: tail fiber domain-containing protein, partial [Candidatus Korobacteraceae bacterium]
GNGNSFSGESSGYNNTTGASNTFSGENAGFSNTTGYFNTFSGADAGYNNTTGNCNSFSGESSGYNNTTGACNTFSGENAGFSNTTGYFNTFSGENAGFSNTTANDNTFSGADAGYNNTTGGGNTFYGNRAGYNNTTGDNNVYISNEGTGSESSTIRIGGNTGDGPQTAAYIAGIYGSSVDGNGIPVYVDNNGQLGTVVSSRRFKEQIADMGDSTDALMELRPVTFLYKPEYSNGDRTLQYGLIAEEVAQVYPELVAYDNDGQPYTVRYQYLTPMLLNEVQKQYRRAEAQADVIKTQEQKIDSQQNQIEEMQQRLSRLEALVGTRTSTAQLDPERRASAGETQ